MMKNLPVSEQLLATIIGVVVVFLVELVPGLAGMEEHLTEIAAIIAAYILGKSGVEMARARREGV